MTTDPGPRLYLKFFWALMTTPSDKWNIFYKLPCTNNTFGLLVVLTCRDERSICLLTRKDKNALVFLLLLQSVPFFLLWVNGCMEPLSVILRTSLWKLHCDLGLYILLYLNLRLWATKKERVNISGWNCFHS